MSFTMASSLAIIREAGANISSTAATSEAILAQCSDNAEGFINVSARYNFTSLYPTAASSAQFLLKNTAAKLAAVDVIKYDMTGFPTRTEAESRINVLWAMAQQNINLIKEDMNRDFMIGARTGVT